MTNNNEVLNVTNIPEWKYTIGEMEENTYEALIKDLINCFVFYKDISDIMEYNINDLGDIGMRSARLYESSLESEDGKYTTEFKAVVNMFTWELEDIEYYELTVNGKTYRIGYNKHSAMWEIRYPYTMEKYEDTYKPSLDMPLLMADLKLLCEAALAVGNDNHIYDSTLARYTLDYIKMVEAGEFNITEFTGITEADWKYLSVYNREHYFDESPTCHVSTINEDSEFDEEFWEAVENRMEK